MKKYAMYGSVSLAALCVLYAAGGIKALVFGCLILGAGAVLGWVQEI
jgi:hypothetical protein